MKKKYEIPINPNVAAQKMTVNAGKYSFLIKLLWNDIGNFWTIGIKEEDLSIDLTALVLREGIDLLNAFVLNIGELWIIRNGSDVSELSLKNLGTDYSLIFITEE